EAKPARRRGREAGEEAPRAAAGVEPDEAALAAGGIPRDRPVDVPPEAAEPPVAVLGVVESLVFAGVHATQSQLTNRAEVQRRIAPEAAQARRLETGDALEPSAIAM